ncbi:UDP-glucose dehydrogenase family protein [Paractinoplanes rishiriensis]|uniref:UDP-glucose 6-dehydrogenase n=1 Tax=Paractinoplanes rishiriensis TaxID=1050105 RepID=A0A919MX40_9ACTN|nr:UDP-glucose/GDP-mannose dehydrogenase family protein [Actinoplanes rishiriensis]GIE98109.1 UDP-glucose 6-dehydrogenase [Actinoplanes rishiriensis]
MRITVIGTGYLGAVHAAGMAEIGHDVLGVDIDPAKIEALADGRPPFFEPGLSELLARTREKGNLTFTTSLRAAAEFGDLHFICVGTPQQRGSYAADLSHLNAVVDGLAPYLERPCLVVGKSTVPVGTAAAVGERLAALAPVGARAEVAWNPEFLREGTAVQDTLHPDRLVAGVVSAGAETLLREVYQPMLDEGCPFVATDLATAELVKVAANSFLATKISFINAMAEVCETAGADVVTLAQSIGYDARIGARFLSAGLGFGGGCLPKDIRAFTARAEELGVGRSLNFLREVDEINMRARHRAIAAAKDLVGGTFLGRNVTILGAAFKPHSDDIRDSPALNVAAAIKLQGAHVCVHDEEAIDNARAAYPALEYAREPLKACEGADVVLHLTEWPQYSALDPAELAKVTNVPRLLEARNTLDVRRWRDAGWTVRSLGRAA